MRFLPHEYPSNLGGFVLVGQHILFRDNDVGRVPNPSCCLILDYSLLRVVQAVIAQKRRECDACIILQFRASCYRQPGNPNNLNWYRSVCLRCFNISAQHKKKKKSKFDNHGGLRALCPGKFFFSRSAPVARQNFQTVNKVKK